MPAFPHRCDSSVSTGLPGSGTSPWGAPETQAETRVPDGVCPRCRCQRGCAQSASVGSGLSDNSDVLTSRRPAFPSIACGACRVCPGQSAPLGVGAPRPGHTHVLRGAAPHLSRHQKLGFFITKKIPFPDPGLQCIQAVLWSLSFCHT